MLLIAAEMDQQDDNLPHMIGQLSPSLIYHWMKLATRLFLRQAHKMTKTDRGNDVYSQKLTLGPIGV